MDWNSNASLDVLFKKVTCFEPIANNEESIERKAIGICSLKEKYDWSKHDKLYDSSDEDDTLDECIDFYYDDMSVGTIVDDYVMPTTYSDDHDWGDNDNICPDLENMFDASNESMFDDINYN